MSERPQDTPERQPEGSELYYFKMMGALDLLEVDPQTLEPLNQKPMAIPAIHKYLEPEMEVAIYSGGLEYGFTRNSKIKRLIIGNDGTLWIYTRSKLYKATARMPKAIEDTAHDVRTRLGIE